MNVWQRRRRCILARGRAEPAVLVVALGGESPHQRLLDAFSAAPIEIARLPLNDLPLREIFRAQFRHMRFEVGHCCGTTLALFCFSALRTTSIAQRRERCCVCDDEEKRRTHVAGRWRLFGQVVVEN